MKTAAVWGATGFVGRHLVAALQQAGWRVRALVRETGSAAAAIPQLESVALPFTANSAQMVAALKGVDVVFHCAGNPEATAAELAEFESATSRFADAVAISGTRRLIHLSTVAVYGADSGQSVGSDSPLEGSGAYARGRIAAATARRTGRNAGPVRVGRRDSPPHPVTHYAKAVAPGRAAAEGRYSVRICAGMAGIPGAG